MRQTQILRILKDAHRNYPDPLEDRQDLRTHFSDIVTLAHKELQRWRPIKTRRRPQDSTFQLMDFFSGAGGMSLGFAALSHLQPFFHHLGGCDIVPDAADSYHANFNAPGVITDIRDLVDDDNALSVFLSKLDNYDPDKPLVIIGCAPCQGFTSHRKKNWDADDHRNTLVGAFASVAVRLNPACIVMENVPEMLGVKYWDHFREAKEVFESAGYIVHQAIYNAASFSVPQERFRALVIAMRRDFILPKPLILHPVDFMTVREAIGHLPPVSPGETPLDDRYHRAAAHREETLATIRAVPLDGGSRPFGVGPKCLDKIKGYSDVYGRLSWDKPAITITHYARNPASGRYIHPEQHRGLTMREAALLQSFPLGFEFCGSFDSVFKQIGEAVAPRFACAVAAHVLTELLSPPPTQLQIDESIQSINTPVSSSYSSVIAGQKMARKIK